MGRTKTKTPLGNTDRVYHVREVTDLNSGNFELFWTGTKLDSRHSHFVL